MWWKKEKPIPLYKRIWKDYNNLIIVFSTIAGTLYTAYEWYSVNVDPFLETTDIVAVAANGNIYTQIYSETDIDENTIVLINLDGQQIDNRIYPEGMRQGEVNIETPIPFTSANQNHYKINIEIIVVGLRTLFKPQTYETTLEIMYENGNHNSNAGFSLHPLVYYRS